MTVPGFQDFMLPIMQITGDGQEHTITEIREKLATLFSLTEEDKRELLPSGRQTKLVNRVSWAQIYLRKSGLLESPSRSRVQITERGRDELRLKPRRIDLKYLAKYPEFIEFRQATRQVLKEQDNSEISEQTPDEILETSYQSLQTTLARDVLEQVKGLSPKAFENLVIDVLVAMGYGGSRSDAGKAVGGSGDEGIDGVIKEDKLGLESIYIQAKLWKDTVVGRPIVQTFAGSLEGQRARKGVFITSSKFSQDAYDYVKRIEKRIVLIDGEQLAQFMIEHNIGVSKVKELVIKKLDEDYFNGM